MVIVVRAFRGFLAFITGVPIGLLGGLIGLGGAEFRLPLLVGVFRYAARPAIVINLAVSLVTLFSALLFRLPKANWTELLPLIPLIFALILGSISGANLGAAYAKRISENSLERIIVLLLTAIGCLLIAEGFFPLSANQAFLFPPYSWVLALILGLGIGLVSSMLGVAGGELIIPTLILIFGVSAKIAGTASLIISLPTVCIGLRKHIANGNSFSGLVWQELILPMGLGSVLGAFLGGTLVSLVSDSLLKLILGLILIISACKMFGRTRNNY